MVREKIIKALEMKQIDSYSKTKIQLVFIVSLPDSASP
jgi:hypothetical protein